MFLSDASTKRPVAMTCLLIALVGLGLNSYRKLSLENLPSADVPYVSISTTWVGATPEDMETDVAKRIEDAVSSIDGLKHIQTTCLENICNILLEFNLDVDVDVAAVVRAQWMYVRRLTRSWGICPTTRTDRSSRRLTSMPPAS